MQRLALCLALLLICGAVSAEQIKPAVKAAIKTPTTSGAAKKVAKKPAAPKGPPAKMLFGAVSAASAPRRTRHRLLRQRLPLPAASRFRSTVRTGR